MNKDDFVKSSVFIVLALTILAVLALIVLNADFFLENIFWIILLVLILVIFWKANPILRLKDYERAVIFKFGKVDRVGGPGWAFVFPFLEVFEFVDLRTKTLDVPKQDVITADNVALKVDAVIYLKVKRDNQSVINSVVEVKDYENAVAQYVISLIRDISGSMSLSEMVSNVEELNVKMKTGAEQISKNWGISVEAVQLQNLEIPPRIVEAMHAEKAAIQERLARIERAKASQAEIIAIKEATQGLSENAIAYYYIKALEELAKGKSTKLVFPMELSKFVSSIGESYSKQKIPQSKTAELIEPYKEIVKEIVDDAVKKAREEKQ